MTPHQKQLLDFIRAYQAEHGGVSPSFDEMRGAIGGNSKSRVFDMLNRLESEGRIRRLRNRARAIEVVEDPRLPNQLSSYATKDLVREANRRGLVVGHIHRKDNIRRFSEIRV